MCTCKDSSPLQPGYAEGGSMNPPDEKPRCAFVSKQHPCGLFEDHPIHVWGNTYPVHHYFTPSPVAAEKDEYVMGVSEIDGAYEFLPVAAEAEDAKRGDVFTHRDDLRPFLDPRSIASAAKTQGGMPDWSKAQEDCRMCGSKEPWKRHEPGCYWDAGVGHTTAQTRMPDPIATGQEAVDAIAKWARGQYETPTKKERYAYGSGYLDGYRNAKAGATATAELMPEETAKAIIAKHREYNQRPGPQWCSPAGGAQGGRHDTAPELFTCEPCLMEDIASALCVSVPPAAGQSGERLMPVTLHWHTGISLEHDEPKGRWVECSCSNQTYVQVALLEKKS